MSKRFVICGYLYDREDAEALLADLVGRALAPQLIELDEGDKLCLLLDVKLVIDEMRKNVLDELRKSN